MKKVYVDCGAHKGDTVKAFINSADYTKDTEIHAFEPNPYSRVHKRFKGKINLHVKATWVEDVKMNFYITKERKGTQAGSLLKEKTSGNLDKKHPLTVQAIDFGKWIKDNFSIDDHIIVKMDIEGAEYKVIPSMIKDGSIKYVNKIYLETHENRIGLTLDDLEVLMKSLEKEECLQVGKQFSNFIKTKILVRAVSSGDEHGASARLRFHRKKEFMSPKYKWKGIEEEYKGDLLFIQKRVDKVDIIKNAKRLGMPVVYDTDDGEGKRRKGDDTVIFPLVDAITTDGEERAEALRKVTDTPVYVVPDGIDYISKPVKPNKIKDKIGRVCTFGSLRSTKSAIKYMLNVPKEYIVTYITKMEIPELKKLKFKEWKLNKIVKRLMENDVCIVTYEETEEKRAKGNARLITPMSLGIPTIVLNVPSCEKAMKECGMEEFVVSSPSQIPEKLKLLEDKKIRVEMQKRFLEYAWKNHSPQAASDALADVFRRVLDESNSNI